MSGDVKVISADQVKAAQTEAMRSYLHLLETMRGTKVHADDARRWWPEAAGVAAPEVVFSRPAETVYARAEWVKGLYER